MRIFFYSALILGMSLHTQASNKNNLKAGLSSFLSPLSFSLAAGNFTAYPGQIQVNESGDLNSIEFNPLVTGAVSWQLFESIKLSPTLGLTLPKSGHDGPGITTWTFYTNFNLDYSPWQDWSFRYGLGWLYTSVSGDGGTQAVGNGVSTDQEFPLPNGSTLAYNFINILGVEYSWNNNWSTRLEGFIYNLFDSQARNLSLALTIERDFSFGEKAP